MRYRFQYGTEPCSAAPPASRGRHRRTAPPASAKQPCPGNSPDSPREPSTTRSVTVEYKLEEGGREDRHGREPRTQLHDASGHQREPSFPTTALGNSSRRRRSTARRRARRSLPAAWSRRRRTARRSRTPPPRRCAKRTGRQPRPRTVPDLRVRGPCRVVVHGHRDPRTPKASGAQAGEPRDYQFFSSDLSQRAPRTARPVPADRTRPGKERLSAPRPHAALREPENCFEPLVDGNENRGNSSAGERSGMMGATPDMSQHVIVRDKPQQTDSRAPLQTACTSGPKGELTLVSILPGGASRPTKRRSSAPATNRKCNGANHMTLTAISHDGNRVEWYEGNERRTTAKGATRTSTSATSNSKKRCRSTNWQSEVPAPGHGTGGAVPDRERRRLEGVLHRRRAPHERPRQARENPPGTGPLRVRTGKGTRAPRHRPERAVERRRNTPTCGSRRRRQRRRLGRLLRRQRRARRGRAAGKLRRTARGSCNLYVEHDGRKAGKRRSSSPDSPTRTAPTGACRKERAPKTTSCEFKTSEVSPDGQYVAFMSENSLTGYDNTDVNSGAARDEEVFLYNDAAEGSAKLICASCNPTAPRRSAPDTDESGEGQSLLVDQPETWTVHVTRKQRTTGWPAACRDGPRTRTRRPPTSRAISTTTAGCSSTAATRSYRATPTRAGGRLRVRARRRRQLRHRQHEQRLRGPDLARASPNRNRCSSTRAKTATTCSS